MSRRSCSTFVLSSITQQPCCMGMSIHDNIKVRQVRGALQAMPYLTLGKQLLDVKLPCIRLHNLHSAVTMLLGQHYILCSNRAVSKAGCSQRLACAWLLHAHKHVPVCQFQAPCHPCVWVPGTCKRPVARLLGCSQDPKL